AADRFIGIEGGIEQVRPEPAERGVERYRPCLEEIDGPGIEADRNRARDLEDEDGPGGRPAPGPARPVAMPRPVHAEVGPKLEAVAELDPEVLAGRDDVADRLADDEARPWAGRPRSGGGQDPAGERRPEHVGHPGQRVSLRHRSGVATRSARRVSGRA